MKLQMKVDRKPVCTIEVWEDNFVGTYKVPGYEMEKGKVCS